MNKKIVEIQQTPINTFNGAENLVFEVSKTDFWMILTFTCIT
jgi:hypothetical protein